MLQGPGWLLLAYLFIAQGVAAFDYDLGVAMGTQEPSTEITPVGAAIWWGFAFADLLVYAPLLAAGLAGHWAGRKWATAVLTAALGITVYWPVVVLASVVAARDVPGWNLPKENEYWIVLPLIAAWAVWGLWYVIREPKHADN